MRKYVLFSLLSVKYSFSGCCFRCCPTEAADEPKDDIPNIPQRERTYLWTEKCIVLPNEDELKKQIGASTRWKVFNFLNQNTTKSNLVDVNTVLEGQICFRPIRNRDKYVLFLAKKTKEGWINMSVGLEEEANDAGSSSWDSFEEDKLDELKAKVKSVTDIWKP